MKSDVNLRKLSGDSVFYVEFNEDIIKQFEVTGEDTKFIGYRLNGYTKKLLKEVNFDESSINYLLLHDDYDSTIRAICPHYKYWNAMGRMCCDLTLRVCSSVNCLLYYIYKGEKENGSE